MCGIAGFFSTNLFFNQDHLTTLTNTLSHRGPNASGFFLEEKVGLGHRRLSIIDLSEAANQPMYSGDKRYVIVFNGEIYNFKEIKQRLIAENKTISFKTNSDTEVILEAFVCWKEKFVDYLNGMFAIAIYDRTEKKLYLFRDRIGKKPIYYFWDEKNFVFASELKSLVALKELSNKLTLNKLAISQFLHIGYIAEPFSIYNEIKKFPAASYAIIKNKLEIKRFWNIEEKITENPIQSFSEAKKKLKELLINSVEYRMISDVPFGTFLSGGIDSSLVTSIAQSISSNPIQTFSIGFENKKYNEAPHAKNIATYLKTNHHEFTVSEKKTMEFIGELDSIFDEPFADSSAIPMLLISKMARQKVTMILSGDGGDELFLGYGMHQWANRLQSPFIKLVRKPISIVLSYLNNRSKRASLLFDLNNYQKLKTHIFSQEQYCFSEKEIQKMINSSFPILPYLKENFSTQRKLSPMEEQALFDLHFYLKDDLLVKVDRTTMRHSLEARCPILDYRIVEFAFNLDSSLKLKDGVSKYILKEVLYDFIPKSYFERPKWGFSIPLMHWLKNDLSYLISTYLTKEIIEKHEIVKVEYVEKLKYLFLEKNRDYLYNRLWLLIVLHRWLEKNRL